MDFHHVQKKNKSDTSLGGVGLDSSRRMGNGGIEPPTFSANEHS